MGIVYSLKCAKCGFEDALYLGMGACDRQEANRALIAQQRGPNSDETLNLLLKAPDINILYDRTLYRCRSCGKYQTRLSATFVNPYNQNRYNVAYYCEDCGGELKRVPLGDPRRPLTCPACGEKLHGNVSGQWDIAPRAEFLEDPHFKLMDIVPLATESFQGCDAEGKTTFTPIKSDIQLRRLESGKMFRLEMLPGIDEARQRDDGYWAVVCPGANKLLASCPANLIRADADELRPLARDIAGSYVATLNATDISDRIDPRQCQSVYFAAEPFNLIEIAGCSGILAYSLWTLPKLEDYSSAIRSILVKRHNLNH